jgi:uncharacterized RDD family membrane protein YckC
MAEDLPGQPGAATQTSNQANGPPNPWAALYRHPNPRRLRPAGRLAAAPGRHCAGSARPIPTAPGRTAGRAAARGAGGLLAALGSHGPRLAACGVLAGAIAALFGFDAVSIPTATPPEGDGFEFRFDAPAPFGVVELAYFTYFHATSAGQSIGNKILGIRVLDADSGGSLPYVRAFVRALMSYLSALPCFLGFFWMLWDPRKRTWHDMVANSLVVRSSVYPPGEFGRAAR